MADAIRLYAEFTDDLGTDWRVNIHQNGWQVSAVEFTLGADGFVLRYSGNNEDRYQPVIGSEVTFTLMETNVSHTLFLEALATSSDPDFTLSIYKDPDAANTLFWTGVILAEQVALMDEAYPILNTINAVDDLGNLKNVLYNNSGTAYTGRDNIAEHIRKCLLKTRALHIYDTTDVFLKYANNFVPGTFGSTNALIQSEVNHSAFYNTDDNGIANFFSAFEVLSNLAVTFNARVFMSEGCFYFIPVGAAAEDETIDFFTVTKGGTVSASTTSISTQVVVGTDIVKLKGGSTTFLPPLQEVRRQWITNGNFPVLFDNAQYLNPVGQQSEIGDAITDNGLIYGNGTVLRLQFQYEHTYEGGGTFTAEDTVGRLVLRLRIKCGSQYYANSVTFGPGAFSYGNFSESYQVDQMNFSEPDWQTTLGYYYIPLTSGQMYLDRNNGVFYANQAWPSTVLYVHPNNVPLTIDLEPLPEQSEDLQLIAEVIGYDHEGTVITDITGANAFGKLHSIAMYAMTGNTTNGDVITYAATTNETNQETYEQDVVQIGSVNLETHRNIFDNISTPGELIDKWNSFANPAVDYSIHQLGVAEILAGQTLSTPVKRGSYHKGFVSPYHTMKFDSNFYLPFETSYTARPVEGEYEAFLLYNNDSGIVAPDGTISDTHDPQDDSEPVFDVRNLIEQESGNIPVAVFQRFLQQPITKIVHSDATRYVVSKTDYMIFNSWSGANGQAFVELPNAAKNEGRMLRFKSDDTISANTYVTLNPFNSSQTIDGSTSFDFTRDYDGVSLLAHDGKWFIIQRKSK